MADIELVIKIPEEKYKEIITYKEGYFKLGYFETIIANGTPLPKGHGRLIDVDKLSPDYDWCEYETDIGQLMVYGYQAYSTTQIESAPIIIEADKAESEE